LPQDHDLSGPSLCKRQADDLHKTEIPLRLNGTDFFVSFFYFILFLFLDNLCPLHLNSQRTTPLWVSLHTFRREINQGIFLASLVRSISLANPFLRQFSLRSTTSGPRISTILSTLLKTALDPGSLFILFYFFFLLFFFEK